MDRDPNRPVSHAVLARTLELAGVRIREAMTKAIAAATDPLLSAQRALIGRADNQAQTIADLQARIAALEARGDVKEP